MNKEQDFDYVVGKLSRIDKDGNDITEDRIGRGGRHRDDGTYSAVAYDLEVVDEDPTRVGSPELHCVEELSLGQQLIYRVAEVAIPYVVDGAFHLAGQGVNAAINYGKRKYEEHKTAQLVSTKKQTLKFDEKQKSSTTELSTEQRSTALDEIDVAYDNYSINMSSEEAQKQFVDAFILRLLSEKKLWMIAHANIVDSSGNITDGCTMIDKLSSPLMLENINTILYNNPDLLDTWQTMALEDLLGRELIVDSCYMPIDGQALKANLLSLPE